MGRIAWGRVVLGGLVASALWWVFEGLVQGVILGQEWNAALEGLGVSEEEMAGTRTTFMLLVTIWSLLAGIVGVWLYAAIRPRYGPGPKTAMIAGIALWVMIYLAPTMIDYAFRLWPTKLMTIPLVTSFFESILATLAGAWLYRET